VFLAGAQHLLHDRVAQRSGHYMPAELLDSQLTALEPPARLFARDPLRFGPWTDRALFVDAASPVAEIERAVLDRLDPPRDAT
jgi:gluconokinase